MTKILIHAVPERLWYVEGYMLPALEAQGAEDLEVWTDSDHRGCLTSHMDSFAARTGDGGTWHLQDDVLLCRDFVKRIRQLDEGVVYGFCCAAWGDDPSLTGKVYMPDAWKSFQCVRIPDAYARDCARWVVTGGWRESPEPTLMGLQAANVGADLHFREYLLCRHGSETVTNAAPNLVEHIDRLIGGSVANDFRGWWARSSLWDDTELVDELGDKLKSNGAVRA